MPVTEGSVEGKKCQVLRDTGSGCVVVQKDLVPVDLIRKTTQKIILIDGQVREFPTARVNVDSPYLRGIVDVVVMDTPLYPCIIGNVDGAADPDFRQLITTGNMDAGRERPPVQGKEDNPSPDKPIAPMEVTDGQSFKEADTLSVSDSDGVCEVEGSTLQLTTEPIPRVQQPAFPHHEDGVGMKSMRIETTDTRRPDRKDDRQCDTTDKTDPVYWESLQPAAACTRSQAASKQPPRRKPLKTIESVGIISRQDIIEAQERDPTLTKTRDLAQKESILDHRYGQSKFFYSNGLLMRNYEEYNAPGHMYEQIVLPEIVRTEVMKLGHEGLLSGHLSVIKTFNRIIPHFYWPAMRADIKRHCQSCDSCQRTVSKGKIPPVPLGDVPLTGEPFRRVGIDLVGPLELTISGKKYILTLVDYATLYPEAVALPNITTEAVAEALIGIFSCCGCPRILHSDKESQFTSEMMSEVCRLLNVNQSFSSAWHPQSNGLTEKMNGTLKEMLRRMCAERPKDWDRYLDPVLFAYREVPNTSTQFSPFELLYGRSIQGPMAILRESLEEEDIPEEIKTSYEYVFDLRNRLEDTCRLAQENLKSSKTLYKKYFDRKTKDRQFAEGDEVLLLLPTEQSKLSMQWRGPYTILTKVGQCDYKINMDGREKVFHANMMKKYWSRPGSRSKPDHQTPSTSSYIPSAGGLPAAAAAVVHEDNDDVIPTFDIDENNKSPDINPELTSEQKCDVHRLIVDFHDRLSSIPGLTDLEVHEVELTTDKPVRSRCYHTPYAMRKVIDEEIEKMVKMGVIEPSKSPYASPVVLVVKRDGSYRFCVDYRRLNTITKFHAEPLPDQEHLFTKLQNAKYLSKFDLTRGYWQLPMREEDKPRRALSVTVASGSGKSCLLEWLRQERLSLR